MRHCRVFYMAQVSVSPHVYFNISIAINAVMSLWRQGCFSFLGVFPTLTGASVGFAEGLPVSPLHDTFTRPRHTSAGSEWQDGTWQRRRFAAPSSSMHLAEALEIFIGTFRSESVSRKAASQSIMDGTSTLLPVNIGHFFIFDFFEVVFYSSLFLLHTPITPPLLAFQLCLNNLCSCCKASFQLLHGDLQQLHSFCDFAFAFLKGSTYVSFVKM